MISKIIFGLKEMQITCLTLRHIYFSDIQHLRDILEYLPLLEQFEINHCFTYSSTSHSHKDVLFSNVGPVVMKHLKRLNVNGFFGLLPFLRAPRIRHLNLKLYGTGDDRFELLESSPNLVSLDVDSSSFRAFFGSDLENRTPFKLKKLAFNFDYRSENNFCKQLFDKFLDQQPSIEEMKFSNVTNEISRNTFTKIKKLRKLQIGLKWQIHPTLDFPYSLLFPNLEFFQISGFQRSERIVSFLRLQPKLKTLVINCENTDPIALNVLLTEANFKHLKFIGNLSTMRKVYHHFRKNFKNLKTLELVVVLKSATEQIMYESVFGDKDRKSFFFHFPLKNCGNKDDIFQNRKHCLKNILPITLILLHYSHYIIIISNKYLPTAAVICSENDLDLFKGCIYKALRIFLKLLKSQRTFAFLIT